MRLKLLLALLIHIAAAQTKLFDFGHHVGDQVFQYSTDQKAVVLPIPLVFLENSFKDLYISSDGIVGFGEELPETILPLQRMNRSTIAVYYAPFETATVYYRSTSSDQALLKQLTTKIHDMYADASEFHSLEAVVVTWDGVQNKEMDGMARFQLTMVTDGIASYAFMLYHTLPWSSSNGIYAQCGFSGPHGSRGNVNSGSPDVKEISGLTNTDDSGTFVFRISGPAFEDPKEADDSYEYSDYNQDYDGDARKPPPADCPKDPYKDNCPEGCNVLTDDRECSRCVCPNADREEEDEDAVATVPKTHVAVDPQPLPEQERPQQVEQIAPQEPQQPQQHHHQQQQQQQHQQAHHDTNQHQQQRAGPVEQHQHQSHRRVGHVEQPESSQPSSCAAAGSTACHASAACKDHDSGYCCSCHSGFYGNGKECLKKGDPVRLSGVFEGAINGKPIDKTDVHGFITSTDGNTFTAISKIPTDLGSSFLLLNSIASVMGFLFAEVQHHDVYNGFQLTGAQFNRSVTMHIGDRYYVTIKQHFMGKDDHGYFKANMFVSGTLPEVVAGAEVVFPDYEEEYKREGAGLMRSYTSTDILLRENGQERRMTVTIDQQIHYKECPFKPFDKAETLKLSLKRIHVNYDSNEQVVRYGSRAYMVHPSHQTSQEAAPAAGGHFDRRQHGQTQQQAANPVQIASQNPQNPCESNTHQCTQPNMRCRQWDQSYRCECAEGYHAQKDEKSPIGWSCHDLNECERGTPCSQDATCTNTDGAYVCECREGFTGDGRYCINLQSSQAQQGVPLYPVEQPVPQPQEAAAGVHGECSSHQQCHQYGECAFTPGKPTGVCKCRGWYTGDGVQHCGPPQEAARPQQHNANIPKAGGRPCGSSVCDVNAECMPAPRGGSECVCKAGFAGTGIQCESLEDEIEEPAQSEGIVGKVCRSHEECSEFGSCAYNHQAGYYQCACREGYSGNGVECTLPSQGGQEVDSEAPGCDVTRDCSEFADCIFERTHSGGKYRCVCQSGYSGDGKSCSKSEVALAQLPLATPGCDTLRNCDRNAQCVYDSYNRRYACECYEGFAGDGQQCVRIHSGQQNWEGPREEKKRCQEQTDCHQSAHCVVSETGADHVCECLPGYKGDGVNNCIVADQCNPVDPKSCAQNSECVFGNQESAYVCKCVSGFTGDGVSCVPHARQTTCLENPRMCHANAQCVFNHQQNSHVCLCKPGSVGDGYHRCDVQETPRCSDCSINAHCAQVANGAWQCRCNAGHQGNGHVCAAITSCFDDRSICDNNAECVPGERGHYVCNCHYGYHGNGRTCKPDTESRGEHSLFVARGMAIFQRGTKQDIPGKQVVVIPHHIAVGLDFDCEQERLVWSDISGHSIRSASLNGTDMKSYFASDLQSPEGIAVDWSSRNVYYADSLNDEIGVASLDGKYKKTLVSEGLVNPRSVALDLYNRHLYYTDWHRENPIIGRVDMDGKNNKVFLNDDVHLPNGITVLPNRRELCWVDAGSHRLSCIGFDGRNRRTVYSSLNYPFGLTHENEEKFYWTDWKDNRIHSVDIYGNAYGSFPISLGGSGKVYGIISIPKKCTAPPSPCSVDNGGCSYLCLPGAEGVHCQCPDNVTVKGCK